MAFPNLERFSTLLLMKNDSTLQGSSIDLGVNGAVVVCGTGQSDARSRAKLQMAPDQVSVVIPNNSIFVLPRYSQKVYDYRAVNIMCKGA